MQWHIPVKRQPGIHRSFAPFHLSFTVWNGSVASPCPCTLQRFLYVATLMISCWMYTTCQGYRMCACFQNKACIQRMYKLHFKSDSVSQRSPIELKCSLHRVCAWTASILPWHLACQLDLEGHFLPQLPVGKKSEWWEREKGFLNILTGWKIWHFNQWKKNSQVHRWVQEVPPLPGPRARPVVGQEHVSAGDKHH